MTAGRGIVGLFGTAVRHISPVPLQRDPGYACSILATW